MGTTEQWRGSGETALWPHPHPMPPSTDDPTWAPNGSQGQGPHPAPPTLWVTVTIQCSDNDMQAVFYAVLDRIGT